MRSRYWQIENDQRTGRCTIGRDLYSPAYQCSPFHTNSALHAVIAQLERAAGFSREDTAEQKLDKLEICLRAGGPNITETAPLIAVLLSLPTERYAALNLSPEKQKEKTLEVLIGQVIGLSSALPVLIIVEDMHWIDPTFEELLALTLTLTAQARVLIVLPHHPEYVPPWHEPPHVKALTLRPWAETTPSRWSQRFPAANSCPRKYSSRFWPRPTA